MSNTIKIEFECPEFSSELEINIVIRKDGKGTVESTTVSYPDPKNTMTENKKETTEVQKNKTTKTPKKKADASSNPANGKFITGDELEAVMNGGGNFMDLTF
jgi:hypothetical protein